MKHPCTRFKSEEISRFVDGELPQETYEKIEKHIPGCPSCRALVENFSQMSAMFSGQVDQQIRSIKKTDVRLRLHEHLKTEKESAKVNFFGMLGQHMYLKVASVLLILVISIFTFQDIVSSPAGPSAIVKSVDTDFASVMIIETQKEKHTIIWFNET